MSTGQPTGSRPSLRLYVAGETPSARRALAGRARLIEATAGEIQIEVVDILERPEIAEAAGILATPTLSDDSVHPPRRLVGDIGDIEQVLAFFGSRRKDVLP